ncbi:uncharacterized protein LOC132565461 [Ylistrum balloti]|uniref:uncharacterized protein LOC132565461 n=1 Tax=Ylistrum balloti TaxID=509963 RepID=UPI002905D938|nr:uncharacterized protein LOC132565461 [Ylistrum balloti]
MKLFLLACLLAGASAGFLDSLSGALTSVKDGLTSAASSTLSTLTSGDVGQIMSHVVVPVAEHAALAALLGKREHPQEPSVQEVISHGAQAVQHVLDKYATELQHFHEQIASLNYLKGDLNQFFADMQHSKLVHNTALDNIVTSVQQALSTHKRQTADSGLLSGLSGLFGSTVDKLKETYNGIHDTLSQGSTGILGALTGHISHLTDSLSHIKDTGAALLATGQETLANLQNSASTLFNQAQAGVQGQASQALDTLLHPDLGSS